MSLRGPGDGHHHHHYHLHGANLAGQTDTADVYSDPNCTGTVVTREVSSAGWTVTHNATQIKNVAGISTDPANDEVDRVTVSIGPYCQSNSGPNVVTATRGGVTKNCVTFANSPSTRLEFKGIRADAKPPPAALRRLVVRLVLPAATRLAGTVLPQSWK